MIRGTASHFNMTATSCAELLRLLGGLWTFLRVDGVGPTNNAGERALIVEKQYGRRFEVVADQ